MSIATRPAPHAVPEHDAELLLPEAKRRASRRRLLVVLATLLAIVSLLVAGMAASGAPPLLTGADPHAAVPPPGATTTAHTLGQVDARCNGGRGFTEPVPPGSVGNVLYTETTSDVTVVAFDRVDPNTDAPASPYKLFAITPSCGLDRSFGSGGFLTPTSSWHMGRAGVAAVSNLSTLAPGLDGRFFLAAFDAHRFWVGEANANGTIDRDFGAHGWVSLRSPATSRGLPPTADWLTQTKDGTIVVTGEAVATKDDYGLPAEAFVYELHADGRPVQRFGHDGMVTFHPPSSSVLASQADQTLVQPNGVVAVVGEFGAFDQLGGEGWGGPGCSHVSIEWLTRDGQPERAVDSRYVAQHSTVLAAGFAGSEFIDATGGVGLIGEARQCHGDAQVGKPFSVIEALTPSGQLDRRFAIDGQRRFTIPDETDSYGFATARLPDGDVVQESYTDAYYVQAFTRTGQAQHDLGRRGVLEIPTNDDGEVLPENLVAGAHGDFVAVVPTNRGITMTERSG